MALVFFSFFFVCVILFPQMETNSTNLFQTETISQSFNLKSNLINLILSATGILTNSLLLIVLLRFRRHQCTTYFLLTLMTIFDLVYCLVYISILLTNHSYLNLINHQILCPLSFFLSPFTFTGSTLLLFICLLHLTTNFTRHYDTFLGQISGRLSIVFVLAFILIRSVLCSTSIELISDPSTPHIQYCTIDMNTPDIVTKVQNINQIFAEVTDILVYIGWLVLLLIYFCSLIDCQKSNVFYSIFLLKSSSKYKPNEHETNEHRHRHVSLIIISITLLSLICYLPVMINKLLAMISPHFDYDILSPAKLFYLQIVQQTMHLFCLTVRFLPYFLFDKQMKCTRMKFQSNELAKQSYQKYICYCQFLRSRQFIDETTTNSIPVVDV